MGEYEKKYFLSQTNLTIEWNTTTYLGPFSNKIKTKLEIYNYFRYNL